MKKSLYSQIAEVVLCAGVILTLVWGCNNVPQDNQNQCLEVELPLEVNPDHHEIDSIINVAWSKMNKDPEEALGLAGLALVKSKRLNYKKGMGEAYNLIGAINFGKSNYLVSLQNYLKAFDIRKTIKDESGVISVQINIGLLYHYQKNNPLAKKYCFEAKDGLEKLFSKDVPNLNYQQKLSAIYDNLGIVYASEDSIEKAKTYYLKSLSLAQEIKNPQKIAKVYNNLGSLLEKQGDYPQAHKYYEQSLEINERIGNKNGIATCWVNIGSALVAKEDYDNASIRLNQGLELAREIGDSVVVMEAYKRLAHLNYELGNINAYNYYQKYSTIHDNLLGEENQRQIAQMQILYETDKKDKEIKILNQANEVKDLQNKKQRIAIYSTSAGILLVILLALVTFRAYKSKKRANLHLAKQKQEIEIQKTQIEHQAKEINDNIIYAKRIQNGVMPTLTAFQKRVPNSFILFKPKDNVSGDFYWMETKGEFTFFAAADCTGHGVSGAMVSMICSSVLNRCVKDFGLVKPGEILDKATELVIEEFQKSETTIQDGMDISLCALNSETDELLWAGANNPLYLVRDQLIEYKADKQHIGKHDHQKSFTTHRIKLYPGDSFYIFSDGYPTQIGGPEDKKFMSKKFKNLLISIQERNMEAQKDLLNQAIEEWMRPNDNLVYEQTDDILVIGVKI